MSKFEESVYGLTRSIPKGKVSTYGEIAKALGNIKKARAVGNALHVNPDPDFTPCFRIVDRNGHLADSFGYGGIEEQKKRLENDGIEVNDYAVDLTKYLYVLGENHEY